MFILLSLSLYINIYGISKRKTQKIVFLFINYEFNSYSASESSVKSSTSICDRLNDLSLEDK